MIIAFAVFFLLLCELSFLSAAEMAFISCNRLKIRDLADMDYADYDDAVAALQKRIEKARATA